MNVARFTRVYSVTYSIFGNVHDLVHSISSQNEKPHFGIPNLLLQAAQQKQEPLVPFSHFGLTFDESESEECDGWMKDVSRRHMYAL